MASRITKSGNTKEFAQATQPWHIADLDSDLDNLFNAGVDTTNIAPNAGILGTQLATGTISATQLAANAVTTAKLLDAAVTTPKLAIGSSINARQSAVPNLVSFGTGTETTLVTIPSLTTRGGVVVIVGTIAAVAQQTSATLSFGQFRLYRDATLLRSWGLNISGDGAGSPINIPVFCSPIDLDTPVAGSYVYTVKFQWVTLNGAIFAIVTGNGGIVHAVELA